MGFDSGILKSPTEPVWEFDPSKHRSLRATEEQSINPLDWERLSVLWFSQEVTKRLGKEAFTQYIRSFHYGNEDVSGDPGKDNGLTEAWLSSSLLISVREQVAFLERFFRSELGVSESAYQQTRAIIPRFEAEGGWVVYGKTGSCKYRKLGWFVGWAERDGRRLLFAELVNETTPQAEYGGFRARERFLKELPASLR